jgi:phage gp36-like protein
MAYSTQDDLLEQMAEDVLIDLTDDAESGEVDAGVVTRAIAGGDALIDAHCQARYPLPLSPVPPVIRGCSVDLAIYNIYSRRPRVAMPETVKGRRDNAEKLLRLILDGKLTLGAETPAQVSMAQTVLTSGNTRLFTRDSLEGM